MLTVSRDELRQAGRDACVRLLVSQVRALQRAHRAGIQPHYGQLESLFDTTEALERNLEACDDVRVPQRCSTVECGKPRIGGSTPYAPLCLDCASKVIAAAAVSALAEAR